MIGKPEWFRYRIFGWGLRPATWQGWLYIVSFIGMIFIIVNLPIKDIYKIYINVFLVLVLLMDSIHIMMKLPKVHDERENRHQLIIERSASYAGVFSIAIIIIYQAFSYKGDGFSYDISLFVVLGMMLLAKIGSLIYVKMKM
jgi:Kef-type K+ transport system membrane component KefB